MQEKYRENENQEEMHIVTINIPKIFDKSIKQLIRFGMYNSRSEVIRMSIRDFLPKELKRVAEINQFNKLDNFIKDKNTIILNGKEVKIIKRLV